MTTSSAPAAMPSVEEIARAIAQADEQNGGPPYEQILAMGKHAREPLFDRARAILALYEKHFAPILAEKERDLNNLAEDWDKYGAELAGKVIKAEARALAAEAALLAVAPYVDSIVCYASTIEENDGNRVAKLVNEAAAAIRAQGE